jgi:hypothetical protein
MTKQHMTAYSRGGWTALILGVLGWSVEAAALWTVGPPWLVIQAAVMAAAVTGMFAGAKGGLNWTALVGRVLCGILLGIGFFVTLGLWMFPSFD